MVLIATFYKFVSLSDLREKRALLLSLCQQEQLCGTILLSEEGINGTIAGEPERVKAVFSWLRRDERLADLAYREAQSDRLPFQRMKVKLKPEIVTLGQPQIKPEEKTGTYVEPEAWNQLISDPDVLIIDTRNDFEVKIGSFRGAVNPQTRSFREFPNYVQQLDPLRQRRVAMFCTGGIRCEKASAYLLSQGFESVYHLKGGILSYLEKISDGQSLWEGECFVFDERVAVQPGLKPGSYELCQVCGHPVLEQDGCADGDLPNQPCPQCHGLG